MHIMHMKPEPGSADHLDPQNAPTEPGEIDARLASREKTAGRILIVAILVFALVLGLAILTAEQWL
jgi:hypothetical protein